MTSLHSKPLAQNPERQHKMLEQSAQTLGTFNIKYLQSLSVLRWIGYGIILLFCFDLVEMILPTQFMNPAWEFNLLGQLVEKAVIPLIGFAFIILGKQDIQPTTKQPLLEIFSKIALIFSIILFLGVPLGLWNSMRLYGEQNVQFESQLSEAYAQIDTVREGLNQVTTADELGLFLTQIEVEVSAPPDAKNFEAVKTEVVENLDTTVEELSVQASEELGIQQRQLLTRSLKWNLGALVTGTLFLIIFNEMSWP